MNWAHPPREPFNDGVAAIQPACGVCTRRWECKVAYLYVAFDTERHLTKIGLTVSPSSRLQHYRSTHRDIQFVDKIGVGCYWTGGPFERRALARLPERARYRGDWFLIEPELAISAIRAEAPRQ